MGRTLRALVRVAHTGEVAGIPGPLIAGLASAGGAALVCTGMSLAWRRYRAWSAPRRQLAPDVEVVSTSLSLGIVIACSNASQTRDETVPSQPAP